MKTTTIPASILSLVCTIAAATPPATPPTNLPPTDAAKTHALYMGADVSLQYRGTLCPVVNVEGDSLVILHEGKRVSVALERTPVAVKIVDVLRLGRNEVELNDLKVDRAYTPGHDPRRKMLAAAVPSSNPGQEMVNAQAALDITMKNLPSDAKAATMVMAQSVRARDQAFTQAGAESQYATQYQQQMQRELDQQLFDAMDIHFIVSSPRLLLHPYVLGVAQIRERDAKPGQIRYWLVAKGLDPIRAEPTAIRVFDGGLPEGYEIVSFHLHVYDGGVEVPTAVSAKRVLLTGTEAYQFVLLEHLTQHKNETVPPSPALADVPPTLRARIAEGELNRPYYVKVDKDGRAGDVFEDPGCTEPLQDPSVAAVFKSARFKPALEKGKPVDGLAIVKLRQLAL